MHRDHQWASLIEEPVYLSDELLRQQLHLAQLIDHSHAIPLDRPSYGWQGDALERGNIHPVTTHARPVRPGRMGDQSPWAAESLNSEPGPPVLLTYLVHHKTRHWDRRCLQLLSQVADERRLARARHASEKETRHRTTHPPRVPSQLASLTQWAA